MAAVHHSELARAVNLWHEIPNAADGLPWYKNKGLMKLNFLISIIYMGQFLNGFDGTIMGSLQALSWWQSDLGFPDATQIGLINGVGFISGALSGPVASWFADKYGRKPVLLYYAVTMCLGTAIACAATGAGHGIALFCVSRVVIGSGVACGLMIMQTLIQEISHPRYRNVTTSAFNQNWVLGQVVGTFLCFGCSYIDSSWSWRIPYLVQVIPALYLAFALPFISESPRFLMSVGRTEEARQFLVDMHGNGDPDDKLVEFEFQEIKGAIEFEQENKQASWSAIWREKPNRHRVALACLSMAIVNFDGSAITSYYWSPVLTLAGITGSSQQTGLGAGLALWGWICQLAGVYICQVVPRRRHLLGLWPVLCLMLVGLTVSSAIFTKSDSTNKSAGYASVAFVFLFAGADGIAEPIWFSYPAEILSYSIRTKGMAAWNLTNNSTSAFNSFVNSIALNKIGWKLYLVYVVVIIVEWLLIKVFFVETFGVTLEEIALAFEGEDAGVAKVHHKLEAGLVESDEKVSEVKEV